jgi:hypothetical protein
VIDFIQRQNPHRASRNDDRRIVDAMATAFCPVTLSATSPTASPPPTPTTGLNDEAVLSMLKTYLALYDRGDYIHASTYLSSSVETTCGGPTALALALFQNHRIEGIDYGVAGVRAWGDGSNKADVMTVETYSGRNHRLVLGLAFVHESDGWKLNDLYPIGAGAFCG